MLLIALLHLWVFFGPRDKLLVPTDTAGRYIEIWHVTAPAALSTVPERHDRPRLVAAPRRPRDPLPATRSATVQRNDGPAADFSAASAAQGTHADDPVGDPPAVLPAPPRLDMDQLRQLARAGERRRVKSPLERVREEEHVDRSIEAHVANAAARGARKDCQTAYASGSAGILALVPLLYGTLTDDGCKWK